MTIAIKDMKMPSCCGKCKFGQRFNPDEDICRIDGHIIKSTLATITQNRDEKCPLIEIEERNKGKWEHDKLFGECAYVCNFCHTIWTSSEIQNMHYCPTCGAEMEGEENGN